MGYGFYKRTKIYDSFLEGVKEGLFTTYKIFPAILGITLGVSMLKASGFFDIATKLLSPVLGLLKFPSEVLPLALIRPFSGSGALAVLCDILRDYPALSPIGRCASLMMGCTETTFYTIAVYFAGTGVENTRHTIRSALCADLIGIISAVLISQL